MGHRFSKRSMDRTREVDPLLMAVAVIALSRCAVDFGLTEEQSRSVAEQAEKVRRGVSKTMNSAHVIAAGWAFVAVCVLMLLTLGWCVATAPSLERAKQDRAIEAANAQARATDTAARERAADQRLTDLKINNRLEKERTDAVSSIPDARPTAGRVALACHRLREQGTRDADLPAECRPGR